MIFFIHVCKRVCLFIYLFFVHALMYLTTKSVDWTKMEMAFTIQTTFSVIFIVWSFKSIIWLMIIK